MSHVIGIGAQLTGLPSRFAERKNVLIGDRFVEVEACNNL